MAKTKLYLKLLSVLFVLLFFTTVKAELYGFNVATIDSLPKYISPSNVVIKIPVEAYTDIKLEIDKKGKVKKAEAVNPEDSVLVSQFKDYFTALVFSPATFESKAVNSILYGQIKYRGHINNTYFFFPDNDVTDWDEYRYLIKSINSSGLQLPQAISFPSINHTVKASDSLLIYPYGLYKVGLDESGKVISIDSVFSSLGTFDGQIQNSILYSEFEPLRYNKKEMKSEFYLLISAFARHSYPTKRWSVNDSVLYDKQRVRVLYLLPNIISPPIPDFSKSTFIPKSVQSASIINTEINVRIDTLGQVRITRLNGLSKRIKQKLIDYYRDNQFYPALDLTGKPVEFNGSLQFYLDSDNNIRIRYLWLE